MKFNNLNELITHIESIPKEKFIKHSVGNEPSKACVIGHINIALHGSNQYEQNANKSDFTSLALIRSFGGDGWDLAYANNNSKNPKQGALNYLKSLL